MDNPPLLVHCSLAFSEHAKVTLSWWGPVPPVMLVLTIGLLWWTRARPFYTLGFCLDYTPAPSACFHGAIPNPLPWSVCWSSGFSSQLLHTSRLAPRTGGRRGAARTDCACLSPFCLRQSGGYALLWASEAPNLSCLSSQPLKGVSKVRETFLFHSSPSGMLVPYQSFASFFHPT